MRTSALYLTSILAGFCMMSLEILGGRMLQPVFGSSIDVWAAVITVFILSLSIGYVVGGRIADAARDNQPLGWTLLAAGICYLAIPALALPFMEAIPIGIRDARSGALVAALTLFLLPSMLLGAVSPILVKLVFVSADRVGRTTGTHYAIGSSGNVLGILVSNFVLLEIADPSGSLLGQGVLLGVLGTAHLAIRIGADRVESAAA